jgi:hypothetical protein
MLVSLVRSVWQERPHTKSRSSKTGSWSSPLRCRWTFGSERFALRSRHSSNILGGMRSSIQIGRRESTNRLSSISRGSAFLRDGTGSRVRALARASETGKHGARSTSVPRATCISPDGPSRTDFCIEHCLVSLYGPKVVTRNPGKHPGCEHGWMIYAYGQDDFRGQILLGKARP